ncbi:MAG: lanthionine synthetase C family protein [Gaiellaceae bacterium]
MRRTGGSRSPSAPDSPVAAGRPEPSLYAGAPGVVLALDALARRGHGTSGLDLAQVSIDALDAWRASPVVFPEFEGLPQRDSSLLAGEAGVLFVAWLLTEQGELADDLHAHVRANVAADDIDELMWGTAGTLMCASALLERTGEERWRLACRDSAEALLARRDADGLWRQKLLGDVRYLGPVHGYVGNVRALLTTLGREPAERLRAEANEILARFATREGTLCNWPPAAGEDLVHRRTGEIRLQWCHGSPGIVATAAPYLDEALLLGGAELVWTAGAHREQKGAGICHGTAGNGYALLAAFERTGDEVWLERARRFAVHALAQAQREPPVYSLWMGGIGAALFASDCLDGRCRYPLFDSAKPS